MPSHIDINLMSHHWDGIDVAGLVSKACDQTLRHMDLEPSHFEISVLACDDAEIARLNGSFRGKLNPTNVLSWPSQDRSAGQAGEYPERPSPTLEDPPTELGDIAVAFETCQQEAQSAGLAFDSHLTHLLVHATLHLLGFDHENDKDATLMEKLEVEILDDMGIDNPYNVTYPEGQL